MSNRNQSAARRRLHLLPAICLALAAQETAPVRPIEVAGTVAHALTGEPLRRASVELRPSGAAGRSFNTTTGLDGSFRFLGLPAGRYRLSAERAGFLRREYSSGPQGQTPEDLDLQAGDVRTALAIKLIPQAVITGRVLVADADPVHRASVHVFRAQYADGRRRLVLQSTTGTNDIREFRISQLAAGKYYVAADASRVIPAVSRTQAGGAESAPVEEGYMPVFHPGAIEPAAAAMIELGPGQELTGVDFRLQRTYVHRVRGIVTGGVHLPENNSLTVYLLPADTPAMWGKRTGRFDAADGSFEFNSVPPGSYTLYAQSRGDRRPYYGLRRLQLGQSAAGTVELELLPAVEVRGRVVLPAGLEMDLRRLSVDFVPELELDANPYARVSQDGSFASNPMPAARYRVRLSGVPTELYLRSVRLGAQEVLEGGIDLTDGPLSRPLVLELAAGAAIVSGDALSARGSTNAGWKIVLAPEVPRRRFHELYRVAETDASGAWQFRDVPPGNYRLYAFEFLEEGEEMDIDLLDRHQSSSVAITLRENATESVRLTLIASLSR